MDRAWQQWPVPQSSTSSSSVPVPYIHTHMGLPTREMRVLSVLSFLVLNSHFPQRDTTWSQELHPPRLLTPSSWIYPQHSVVTALCHQSFPNLTPFLQPPEIPNVPDTFSFHTPFLPTLSSRTSPAPLAVHPGLPLSVSPHLLRSSLLPSPSQPPLCKQ